MDSSAVLRIRATNGGWCWMKLVHRRCFHSPPQRKRRGNDPLGSSHPSTTIGRIPKGSTAFKSERGRQSTPQPCHATRGRGDGQGRGGRGEAKGSAAACLGARAAAVFSSLQRARYISFDLSGDALQCQIGMQVHLDVLRSDFSIRETILDSTMFVKLSFA
ncbi:hypothetical protein CXB51_026728 [Gossypium anomalum]|uniref:Uncharacterized protein n=1 Tax=Gossypium anomalum TaxID=47600 RepID=A0A8J5YNC0_9ROSI|nr:hypothetical protein CXB51_026728 [Gossypium anomalum]